MNINFTQQKNVALGNVIEQLEAHWSVLEAELIEITKDIKRTEEMKVKYGQICEPLYSHLKELKQKRKTQMRQIQNIMQKFDFDTQKGITLLQELDISK
ncbi:Conserved_hypothetical protein [Hexamita inflata]|uniref:Uncharacterized protein n=1 Tax=Hexamita inflata TaxID=28002 RepID=A0AA86TMU1_9EUKA|nr:Conserved hypothetical protein [Hexamita inflata]